MYGSQALFVRSFVPLLCLYGAGALSGPPPASFDSSLTANCGCASYQYGQLKRSKGLLYEYYCRGRGEVLGQAGIAEVCAYALEEVSRDQKSKTTTSSSNFATPCLSQYFPPHPSILHPFVYINICRRRE